MSRFTEMQIIGMIRDAECGCMSQARTESGDVLKLKIEYGGLEIAEARWLNALEDKTPS